jgi:mannose-6-phosphate isomerase-like protein (cupin superfamily)
MNLSVNECDAKKIDMMGRDVYWLQTPETTGGKYNSVCTVIYKPGARAKPAHGHDNGEETIFVITGKGKVKIGDDIYDLTPGTAALFPQGVPHMIWNNTDEPLHIVCFYGPEQSAIEYTFYDDYDFDEFKETMK